MSKTTLEYIIIGVVAFFLIFWIVYDIISSTHELWVEVRYLESQVLNLEERLVTDRYVVYINIEKGDTLYLPAFEEIPKHVDKKIEE